MKKYIEKLYWLIAILYIIVGIIFFNMPLGDFKYNIKFLSFFIFLEGLISVAKTLNKKDNKLYIINAILSFFMAGFLYFFQKENIHIVILAIAVWTYIKLLSNIEYKININANKIDLINQLLLVIGLFIIVDAIYLFECNADGVAFYIILIGLVEFYVGRSLEKRRKNEKYL